MKNILKIFIILIVILIMMCQLSITYASDQSNILGGETAESFNPSSGASAGTGYFTIRANKVVGLIRNIGIVVAVIALMAIGLKEMTASVEERSNIKKALPVYILGVVMVVAITVLPSIIYNVTTGKESKPTASTTTSKSGGTNVKDVDRTKVSNEVIAKAIQAGLAFLKNTIEMYVYDEPQDAGLIIGSQIGEDEEVTWQSSNNKVATVVDGKVYAEEAGTAVITATVGGRKASFTVNVQERPVEVSTLSLSSSSKSINLGETNKLTLKIFPSNSANNTVTWTSSDESVVKLSTNKTTTNTTTITYKGLKSGKAIITAKAENGVTKECYVTVLDANLALDKDMVLIDNSLFRFTDIKATYTPSSAKIKWTSSDEKVATVNSKGRVTAKSGAYGKTTITATLYLDGKKHSSQKCDVRVMAPGTQNTHQPGEKQYDPKNDKGQHVRYVYCTQTVQFTRAEIESYVENAAYLINTYPTSFNGQSKEQNLYLYPLRGGTHTRVVMNKKAKEIDANGWIILFTSKNQHLWLLQKQNGKWKVVEDMRASAGSECGGSCKWTTVEYQDSAYGFKWNGYNNSSLNTSKASNAIHNSTTGCDEGVPTSNGCIHMGDKSGQMFKKIVAAGVGIKLIIY